MADILKHLQRCILLNNHNIKTPKSNKNCKQNRDDKFKSLIMAKICCISAHPLQEMTCRQQKLCVVSQKIQVADMY